MSYVFGYTNFIDGSARGLLPAGNTFYQMKSRETFAPMGPYLVTADEVPNPDSLQIRRRGQAANRGQVAQGRAVQAGLDFAPVNSWQGRKQHVGSVGLAVVDAAVEVEPD